MKELHEIEDPDSVRDTTKDSERWIPKKLHFNFFLNFKGYDISGGCRGVLYSWCDTTLIVRKVEEIFVKTNYSHPGNEYNSNLSMSRRNAFQNSHEVVMKPYTWDTGQMTGLYKSFLHKWEEHFTEAAYQQRVEDAACARMRAVMKRK